MIEPASFSTGGISSALIDIQNRAQVDSASTRKLNRQESQNTQPPLNKTQSVINKSEPKKASQTATDKAESKNTSNSESTTGLSETEKSEVRKLKVRDTEVRAHEQAHMAVGGNLVRGGANYQYTTGPDEKRYAVGGEVSIDTSPVENDPKATIQKGQKVQRAAMAPAQPSSQDYSVASAAQKMIMAAQMELARMNVNGGEANGDKQQNTIPREQVSQAYQQNSSTHSVGFQISG